MKRALAIVAGAFGVLVAILLMRTALMSSKQVDVAPTPVVEIDAAAVSERLRGAIPFRTVSNEDPAALDTAAFLGLHAYLAERFPRVHAALPREVIAGYSLLYTWTGTDATLPPVLLMAHLDVVPVEPGTEADWTHPPFDGVIADGFVWGRGAIDDKAAMMGILEATEHLLAAGFQPRRTVYLAVGHDEEVGGTAGAKVLADTLAGRGIRFETVLDEGHVIVHGMIPGVTRPVAFIGIAEKGYIAVELTVEGEGGHSSMPPPHTAIGELAAAVSRLEDHPMPGEIRGPVQLMFEHVAPEMSFPLRMAFANLWLLGPVVKGQLAANPGTNALMRTTTAVTIFSGGVKANVLPKSARAVVNYRIAPGDSAEAVLAHVRAVIDDERMRVTSLDGFGVDPSPVSRIGGPGWERLRDTIREVFPDAAVAPGLTVGATDSRHFVPLADDVYRFLPARFGKDDRGRVHGTDERIAVDNYVDAVRFYIRYLENTANR